VRNAPLRNLTGAMDTTNVQGEIVQKLDDYSNQVLMDYCKTSAACAGYLSEENEGVTTINETGSLVIAVDPLDGSSNIDIAAPIGTIFAIWKRQSAAGPILATDFLQKGDVCLAAGYVLYGSATMLMLSVGKGVQLFALNTINGAFEEINGNVQLPAKGKIYSMNQGNLSKFEEAAKSFVNYCTETDKATSRPYSIRYIGSMVGDMYRTFLKGGVFLYPAYEGETKGKLRLLYECIPMSFLAEQAGGKGTNGKERILSLQPTELHERCAIVIGSSELVDQYLAFSK
jgi:fructose-1,6-bisphosphatase I